MKKRMLMLALFVVLAATLLMGCMRIDESFVVNADGSAKISAEILFGKQDLLDIMQETLEEEGETVTEQDLVEQLTQNGYQLVTKDGKEYFSYAEAETGNQSYTKLKDIYRNEQTPLLDIIRVETSKDDYISLTETSFEAAISANAMDLEKLFAGLDRSSLAEVAEMTEAAKEQLRKGEIHLSITFAAPVVNASEDAVLSADKKTVSFTVPFLNDNTKKLYAYCENDIVVEGVTSGVVYGRTVTYNIPEGVTATLNGSAVQGSVSSEKTGTYDLCLKAADGTQKSIYYEVDKKAPAIGNIKNNGVYSIKTEITISDAQSGIDSVTLDGKNIISELDITFSDKLSGLLQYNYELKELKEGKHTLAVSDKLGNTSSITFQIDKTAPKVTGVKNNKTYKKAVTIKVTDKNGVKSITLNGKKIKSGKKVSKNGSYKLVATDKAGNTKTIKFKIKK